MANYNLTQTGDEVQAYIDSIPVIDVTGTLSGSTISFGSNPYSQIAANYAADCSSIVRLTVGTAVYLLRVTQYDGTNYTASEMSGAHNVVATIGSSSASATIDAGIDATPTQGSDNLVKSGGVHNKVFALQRSIISLRPQSIASLVQWYPNSVGANMTCEASDIRISSGFFVNNKKDKLTINVGNTDYKLNIIGYIKNGSGFNLIASNVQSYDDYIGDLNSYFVLIIRRTDNGNLTVNDVVSSAQITIASLPQTVATDISDAKILTEEQGQDIETLEQGIEALNEIIISDTSLTVELGTWGKYPVNGPGNYRKEDNAKRMRSDKFYTNNGNSIKCVCKTGYECNLFYLNSSTGSTYLSGWNNENVSKQNSEDYPQVVVTFKKSDNTNVSSADLDCLQSFIINSDFDEVSDNLEDLQQIVVNGYSERPSSGYEEFTVQVDTNVSDTEQTTLSLQDSQTFEGDNGKIYLPTSYSATGKPTRLIIHCHGASQNYNNGNIFPEASSLVTIDYLLAKGYAVLDVNGLPGTHSFYATTCGNPVAYRSYLAAYKWAIAKFNLHKEIFVIGISAGSVPALQISQIKTIPVLACVTYCGIMDTSRGWMLLGGYHGNNSQGPDIKAYLADKFAFVGTRPTLGNVDPCSDEEWAYFVSNWIKISGWNPYTMGISSTMTKEQYREIVSVVYGSDVPAWINADYTFESVQKMLLSFKIPERGNLTSYATQLEQEQKLFDTCSIYRKTPLKMFHATNDDVAPYRYSRYFYEMCKRGGSTVEFRTFPSGGHSPVGDTQSVVIDGQTISTNVLSIEVLDWLQRFETL